MGSIGGGFGRITAAQARAGRRRAGRRGGATVIHPIVVPGFTRQSGFFGRTLELKFHDLDIDDATIANTGVIAQASCNLIAQGTTEVQRIGRKCTIRSINWRFNLTLPESDAQADPINQDIIRVIIYLDKQCNGATAAVLDIVETADYQSFNNLANKSRFRTLMDRVYDVNNIGGMASDGAGVVSSTGRNISDTFFKRVNIPIEFSGVTGAITEIRSNNIGVLFLGSNGVAGFFSKMRIRFSDSG